jgi:hypothetical protein
MTKDVPFDVWDGEDLGLTDEDDVDAGAAEEAAMHVDPDSEPDTEAAPTWSELTDEGDSAEPAPPMRYFPDEQPEADGDRPKRRDEREPDLEELLERQHYSFPPR